MLPNCSLEPNNREKVSTFKLAVLPSQFNSFIPMLFISNKLSTYPFQEQAREQALKLGEIRKELIQLKRKYLVMQLEWWERMNKNNFKPVKAPIRFKYRPIK